MDELASCECVTCGRLHRVLGIPPWAPTHEELCHLSRVFNQASDLRTQGDQRINEFLRMLIASKKESSTDERDGAVAKRSVSRSEPPSSEGGEEKTALELVHALEWSFPLLPEFKQYIDACRDIRAALSKHRAHRSGE